MFLETHWTRLRNFNRELTLLKPVAAIIVSMTIFACLLAAERLTYPYSIDYGEGLIKLSAIRFLLFDFGQLYPEVSPTNVVPTSYTPLYYIFTSALMQFDIPAYVAGRMVGLLSSFGICILIFKAVKHESQNTWLAALSSGFFLLCPSVFGWLGYMRVDFTGVFFAILGLYLFIYHKHLNSGYIACCFVFAILAKHSLLIAPAAVFIALALTDWKRALTFALFFSCSLAAALGLIWLLSDGRFPDQIMYPVKAPVTVQNSYTYTMSIIDQTKYVLFLAIVTSVLLWIEKKSVWALYFILSFTWNIWTVGKEGSNIYYFIDSFAATSILIGLCLIRLKKNQWLLHGNLILVLLLFQLVSLVPQQSKYALSTLRDRSAHIKNRQELENIINRAPGKVLSDDPGLLADSNKPLTISSFEYKQYVRNGILSESSLIQELKEGQYSIAVLGFQAKEHGSYHRFTPATMQSVYENFRLIGRINNVLVDGDPNASKWIYVHHRAPETLEKSIVHILPQLQMKEQGKSNK